MLHKHKYTAAVLICIAVVSGMGLAHTRSGYGLTVIIASVAVLATLSTYVERARGNNRHQRLQQAIILELVVGLLLVAVTLTPYAIAELKRMAAMFVLGVVAYNGQVD